MQTTYKPTTSFEQKKKKKPKSKPRITESKTPTYLMFNQPYPNMI